MEQRQAELARAMAEVLARLAAMTAPDAATATAAERRRRTRAEARKVAVLAGRAAGQDVAAIERRLAVLDARAAEDEA